MLCIRAAAKCLASVTELFHFLRALTRSRVGPRRPQRTAEHAARHRDLAPPRYIHNHSSGCVPTPMLSLGAQENYLPPSPGRRRRRCYFIARNCAATRACYSCEVFVFDYTCGEYASGSHGNNKRGARSGGLCFNASSAKTPRDFAARHVENGDNGICVFGIESRCYCCAAAFVNFVAWDVDGFQRIIV